MNAAGLMLRFKAFMIDYIFILVYLTLIFVLTVFLFPSLQRFYQESLIQAQLAGFIMVTLPVSLYFIIGDSKIGRQSIGKKKTSIQVVDENGEPPSILHAAIRTLLKFFPWELSHFLVYRVINIGEGEMAGNLYSMGALVYAMIFTYILTAVWTKEKQSLYDLAVNTRVVKIP
ncbi:RDD family protein [Sediminibacillus massiliensis]|uniref:RDD family protein n=1 Tax=Sediminibacillus massiliensis TaxID=1926277 RepID=UPI001FEA259D|nr:RDD family protein [Sediminibacillus massiliensis]